MPVSVLLVDDDPAFRKLAGRMLADMHFEVVGEADGVEAAVVAASELKPDAALVDIGLPDGDGFALALLLHDLPWKPRVVLTSADAGAATLATAHKVGAAGFVPKGELPSELARALLNGE